MLDLTADIIDVRDITDRVDDLLERDVPRIVAGWNMPGYMPDSDPAEFDNFEDARAYIAEELRNVAEGEFNGLDDEQRDAIKTLADQVENGKGEFADNVANYHYFVVQEDTTTLDADEAAELASLTAVLDDLKGNGGDYQRNGDWYPATLIRDSYFTDYAQELVEDIGDLPNGIPSYIEIDWDATARNIQMDYTSVEIDGETYWYR